MNGSRLPRRAVVRHLDRLADDLTPRQLSRLRALAELIDDEGRIPLDRALAVATPGGDAKTTQAAFRQFRSAVKEASAAAGVTVELVTDGRKSAPAGRFCWFEGEDTTAPELAERSAREARRMAGDALVEPTVAEVFAAPPATVFVSIAGGESRGPVCQRERDVVALLRERLTLRRDREYRVISPLDIDLGRNVAAERRGMCVHADVVLVLVSPAYLSNSGGDVPTIVTSARRRPVLEALERLPHGLLDAQGLSLSELHQMSRPFGERRTREGRVAFVDECLVHITDRLAEPVRADISHDTWDEWTDDLGGGCELGRLARRQAERNRPQEHLVVVDAQEIDLAQHPSELVDRTRNLGRTVPAVERLLRWATDDADAAQHLCALLGDVGMGKTTTTKLFTEQLLERRATDPTVPLPILFDLRDLPLTVLRDGPNPRRIIEALLDTAEASQHRPSADDVLDVVARGNCVLIFDGLDEVLVHLEPHPAQVFTRTLWRATEDTWLPTRSGRALPQRRRPSRLLLSCRTHYFRSIRDEANHFTGQHRDGPAARDYLALLLLPFNEGQIRDYLRANLPDRDVDTCLALIDSVHNLREIAERPLTLRMVTEQLKVIERAKFDGRPVRAVDLYSSFVAQWLDRDNGKHSLLPEHKQLLMEHLAGQLWRSGATGWTVHDVEQWLLKFMASRPDLELHYPTRTPAVWKEDLRTATFLVRRDDDTFVFAHTSLREYFLACYLLRGLQSGADRWESAQEAWSMPVPSRETLAFLGQLLAGLDSRPDPPWRTALTALAGSVPGSAAAVLAFAYGLVATTGGYPHHPLTASRLDGADLRGWRIEAPEGARLNLRGSSFARADLTGAVLRAVDLQEVDLTHADLTRAELHHSNLRAADLRHALLTGTILRSCSLHDARWDGSTAHRAQALHCDPAATPGVPGWLTAPTGQPPTRIAQLTSFTGHTGRVVGGVFSPDAARILTTSDDGTARVWDAATGETLYVLTGHTGAVVGGVFSPDAARILTTSRDGTARVWDAATGETLYVLTGHTDRVVGGVFSPDAARILTTSWDGTARVWDAATGEQIGWQLEQLPERQLVVWSVPDHRVLGASPDAWRWLGWLAPVDGVLTRLPAETFGALPPLDGTSWATVNQ